MRQLPARDPGVPDNRSATRYMLWIWREQWRSQVLGVCWGVSWMLGLAVMPAVIGRAIDRGLMQRSTSGLLTWSGVVVALAVATAMAGALRHRNAMTNWLSAAYVTIQVTSRHAVKVGADLPRLIASGDVLAIGTTDVEAVGSSFDILARLSGGIVSTIVVAIIMLTSSVPLGLIVLIGVPVMMLGTMLLLRPLRRRQDRYRALQGELSDETVDIAQGIRILRGIGGEEAFSARYAAGSQRLRGLGRDVGRIESLLAAQEVLLPGLLTALVTWLAAHFALRDSITIGQLVAFYGYASFLVLPLSFFGEAANAVTRGHVASGRIVRLLRLESPIKDPEAPLPAPPPASPLADAASGLTIVPGEFLAVACNDPDDADRLANRLARYTDDGGGGADGGVEDVVDGADGADGSDIGDRAPTIGGVPLNRLPVSVVRERILLAGNGDRVFAGTLRTSLTGIKDTVRDESILEALHASSVEDIVAALDNGLDAEVEEKGRNFSGGQLQRLRLARALIVDPEILIAVEATSAVDAHTEARIAERIGGYRATREGMRATVLFTTSPLVLDHADAVAYVENGHVVATGKHGDLLAEHPRYVALVTRGEDDADDGGDAVDAGDADDGGDAYDSRDSAGSRTGDTSAAPQADDTSAVPRADDTSAVPRADDTLEGALRA